MNRFAFVLGFALLAALAPGGPASAQGAEPHEEFAVARVVDILRQEHEPDPDVGGRTVQTLKLRLEGSVEHIVLDRGVADGQEDQLLSVGDRLVMEKLVMSDGTVKYLLKEHYRLPSLLWLFALFLLLAVVLGGWTSVMSVAGLLVSIGILLWYVIPQILAGAHPMVVSLTGCALIACTSLYLAHGFTKRTSVALLSTLMTLAIAAFLALFFVHFGKLFGAGSEEAVFLQLGALGHVNLRGLLLGGILIGSLGVLDDITTAQTAAVDEIRKANPRLSRKELLHSGRSVGKEHIASLINTLALAYVGASLPLLLLFRAQADFPLWVTLNSEFLSEEIIRTLVGSATLLFAVPIATWCAAVLLRTDPGDPARLISPRSPHHHA